MTTSARPETEPQSILVAVDLEATLADLSPVFPLARATEWPVHLLHAAAPEPAFMGYDDPGGVYDKRRRATELTTEARALEEQARYFGAEGLEAHSHVIVGPTLDVLLAQAEALNAAMIVIIGHQHNVVRRVVLGSVATSLLKVAPVPVLVLPPPTERQDPGLNAAVDRLIGVIDRDEPAGELAELRKAAASQLDDPESTDQRAELGGRLRDAWQHFETDHPSLIRAMNDVGYYLSGTGV